MASRPVTQPGKVVDHGRGDAALEGKLQKKNAIQEGKNRRALGDIGNLVTVRGGNERKPQQEINRPITRSFCAQLLANAQVAAAANRKQINTGKAPTTGVARKPVVVQKVCQKKEAAKPNPEEVIDLSSDAEVEKTKEDNKKKKENVECEKKKHAATYSSILSARSKAACGLDEKLKKLQIIDIDGAEEDGNLAGIEYVEDMYKFYKSVEAECLPQNYMGMQTEINEKMRSILVDWLIEVNLKFELSLETFYLTINITDRFLSKKTVPRRELQLVGIAALLIASKYEEIWPPQVNDLVYISDHAYSHEQIQMMEKSILGKLEWYLTVPTQYVFLARFIKAAIPDKDMESMVYFLGELGIMHYEVLKYCPSMIAASAVYAARCALNKTPAWTDTLEHHTGYSESQLMECAKLLAHLHSKAGESKLRAAYKKYSKSENSAVALCPPAKCLLP